eukprot:5929307-Prymnesium_polylepis.1
MALRSAVVKACMRGGCEYAQPTRERPRPLATAAARDASPSASAERRGSADVAVESCGGS